MKKFFVLFRIPVASMDEWMKTPEADRKKQMDEIMTGWNAWREKHKDAVLDGGAPLGKTKTVTGSGITDSRNDLNYFMLIQAPSHEEAAAIVAENPHLTIPTSSIDVIEIPHTGM
jgi:hypothetical protein